MSTRECLVCPKATNQFCTSCRKPICSIFCSIAAGKEHLNQRRHRDGDPSCAKPAQTQGEMSSQENQCLDQVEVVSDSDSDTPEEYRQTQQQHQKKQVEELQKKQMTNQEKVCEWINELPSEQDLYMLSLSTLSAQPPLPSLHFLTFQLPEQ